MHVCIFKVRLHDLRNKNKQTLSVYILRTYTVSLCRPLLGYHEYVNAIKFLQFNIMQMSHEYVKSPYMNCYFWRKSSAQTVSPNPAQYGFGSQPTSGRPPTAVQCFNPVQQLRSWTDELLCGTETEGEEGDVRGRAGQHVPMVPLIAWLWNQVKSLDGWCRLANPHVGIAAAWIVDTTKRKLKKRKKRREGPEAASTTAAETTEKCSEKWVPFSEEGKQRERGRKLCILSTRG